MCICMVCAKWVDCDKMKLLDKPFGFCLTRDLFTYTAETECGDYLNGIPFSEEEFEIMS